MWLNDNTCADIFHEGWNVTVSGSPTFKPHKRNQNVKKALKSWNSNHFGNCYKKIEEINGHIANVQIFDKSYDNLALDSALQVELDIWLKIVETLCSKSKDKWLKDGDANTKYFHLSAINHARNNRIPSIKNRNDQIFFERDSVGNCFIDFYKVLFQTDYTDDNLPFPHSLDNLFHAFIYDNDNSFVHETPSSDLIKKTLFSLASNKSPGPDGLPPSFYKNFWKTTKKAFVDDVQHFFRTGHLLKALNSTFIALVPKHQKASRVDQFRPISLYNVTYETISKILACRLKIHLNHCISPYQMAFVFDRNIHHNSIISHELMHHIHNKKGNKGLMAIKVDLAKAFDRVEWHLLICILKNLGFSSKFCDLIHK